MNTEDKITMNKVLFTNLVMMLSTSAMQQLGKLMDPASNKTSVDLEAAHFTIDMLDMLKSKTESNLDADESKLLNDSLTSLHLNYVETMKIEKEKKEAEPAKSEDAEESSQDDSADDQSSKTEDDTEK